MSRMTDEEFEGRAKRFHPAEAVVAEARRARAREAELERALSASQERERVLREVALRVIVAEDALAPDEPQTRRDLTDAWSAFRAALQSPPTPAPESHEPCRDTLNGLSRANTELHDENAALRAIAERWAKFPCAFDGGPDCGFDACNPCFARRVLAGAAAPAPEPDAMRELSRVVMRGLADLARMGERESTPQMLKKGWREAEGRDDLLTRSDVLEVVRRVRHEHDAIVHPLRAAARAALSRSQEGER